MSASHQTSQEFIPLRPSATQFLPQPQIKAEIQLPEQPKPVCSDLTRKEKTFVENVLRGLSDKASATKAGYAPSVAENAWEIKNRPHVQRELRRRLDEAYEGEELTTNHIINGWRRVVDSNLLDYGYVNEDGKFTFDLRATTREQMDVVEEISFDAYGKQKIRLASKQTAREALAKVNKVYASDQDNGDGSKYSIQELDALVKNYSVTINQVSTEQKALPQHETIEAR